MCRDATSYTMRHDGMLATIPDVSDDASRLLTIVADHSRAPLVRNNQPMERHMQRNWDELGIAWDESEVSRRAGSNDSDKKALGIAQIPVVKDISLAIAAGLTEAMLAGINGTSWRVSAQDVARNFLAKVGKRMADGAYALTPAQVDDLREAAYNRVRGLRSPATRTQQKIVIHTLPNGTKFDGTDETEYRQAFAATLIDLGVPADAARAAAISAEW